MYSIREKSIQLYLILSDMKTSPRENNNIIVFLNSTEAIVGKK